MKIIFLSLLLLLIGGCKIDWNQLTSEQKSEVERYLSKESNVTERYNNVRPYESKERCPQAPEIDANGSVLYISILGMIVLLRKENQ